MTHGDLLSPCLHREFLSAALNARRFIFVDLTFGISQNLPRLKSSSEIEAFQSLIGQTCLV